MLGTFTYYNPTRLHFGAEALNSLATEVRAYGKTIVLAYGGGSVKRSGLYDQIVAILEAEGKVVVDLPGVMSNPTIEKVREGAALVKEHQADLILAVGGGSVVDYAKAVSVSAYSDMDPWEKYFVQQLPIDNPIVPVGAIVTMVGTASEMNGGSVISNHEAQLKLGRVFGADVFPKFAIVNPELTYTVPHYQMVAGIFDIMSHLMEQYFSNTDDNTSDYIIEGMMRSLINSSRAAVQNPKDYEARSNIAWTATWALNGLVGKGKAQDWMVHMIGHAIGAVNDATHGMTLASISLAYYRHELEAGLAKFVRFAKNVWDIHSEELSEIELAEAGLQALEAWMKEIGVVTRLSEIDIQESDFDAILAATRIYPAGYQALDAAQIREILRESL